MKRLHHIKSEHLFNEMQSLICVKSIGRDDDNDDVKNIERDDDDDDKTMMMCVAYYSHIFSAKVLRNYVESCSLENRAYTMHNK